MKNLSVYLFLLLFTLQTPSLADDISDFQIEGMSIGDSLLDYMSVSEINNSKRNYFTGKRKYYVVGKFDGLETYEAVDIYLKSGDSNYIIRTIGGMILLDKEKCLSKKKEISKEMDKIFINLIKDEHEKSHEYDKSGKSKQYQTSYFFGKGTNRDNHIRVECDTWSKEIKEKDGFTEGLNVVAMTTEILDWIYSGYK